MVNDGSFHWDIRNDKLLQGTIRKHRQRNISFFVRAYPPWWVVNRHPSGGGKLEGGESVAFSAGNTR